MNAIIHDGGGEGVRACRSLPLTRQVVVVRPKHEKPAMWRVLAHVVATTMGREREGEREREREREKREGHRIVREFRHAKGVRKTVSAARFK